ncbi:MAG: LPS-assembly protein LptD [Ignavibacteriales bacterium]|nr:LPS-assembly protein LptD [Ignavibacteriales bacterium]
MKYLISILIILFCSSVFAQQKDSTSFKKNAVDSLLLSDSTKSKKKYDVDAIVFANASDSLIFDVQKKKMFVHGSGELKYKTTDLKSAKIFVDYNTNELVAFGAVDTSDTAKVKLKQSPRLTEGAETYEGERIKYNFKNQRGYISLAKNKDKGQTYAGEEVNKVDKSTYFIKNGTFTTCDSDTPHTYFSSSEMKVIQKDKIIARWIFMYIGGVPFPIPLPFAVFPNETGRRSGIIIPAYGQENNRGQYFRNFGYFLSMNDYMDLALTGDYYTKGGWGARSRFRYAERYNFTGTVNAGYSKIILGETNDPGREERTDWNLSWYHNQQINPSTRLDVNLQFLSSNFFRNNSINYNDILSQDITSNATFSKIWDESGASLSINYNRTQNLTSGNIYESLPNINFSKSMTYPFKRENVESLNEQKWYELIGYSYSGQFTNNRRKTEGNLNVRAGVLHNISLSASPKFGYFNVSPSFNYSEKWYNKRVKYEYQTIETTNPSTGAKTTRDTLVESRINEFNFVRTFSMSMNASTRLYGILNPNILGIESFRHTLTPSVSYNYQPDFSSDAWGYYDSYKKSNGEVIRYDKYSGEVFGGVSSGQSQSLFFSLGNVFEIKMAKNPNDTTKEQKKIQLLNLNASVGYNFAADSMKLSDLSLGYRTQIGDLLSFSGSSSYTFYDYAVTGKDGSGNDVYQRINQYLASNRKGLLRLTNFSFSVSTSLSGEKLKPAETNKQQKEQKDEGFNAFAKKDYIGVYDQEQSPDLTIPWNLSLSYNYNFSKPTPNQSQSYSNLNADLGFSLTKNWKFTIRGSYDFETKQVSAPQVTIYRDLHCWEMNFNWNPLGYYSGFRFEIRLKAPELQDIKVTKSGGLYSGRR